MVKISTSEISLLGVASSEIALEADPVHFTHSHPLGEHRRLSRAAPGDPHGAAPACADAHRAHTRAFRRHAVGGVL